VANSGPVVSQDAVARLTEPFERLHRGADRTGSGLGLSIARAVCEAHGAALTLHARPGGGLVAEVRIAAAGAGGATAGGRAVLMGS
jgi:signal transduction histidine kinase